MDSSFRIGSKVRVRNYPRAQDKYNLFDYNNKVGTIRNKNYVGRGLNNMPAYSYEVFFENVTIPQVKKLADGRLDRTPKIGNAANWFDECYLEAAE